MSDKGKPTDFTPMEPAAPSPWDDSVEFELTEEAKKKLTETPLPADPPPPTDEIKESLNTADTIADKPMFEPSVVVSGEAFTSEPTKTTKSSTTVREHTPEVENMPQADAVTRVTAMPMRPQVKSSKLMPVARTSEASPMAEVTTSMVPKVITAPPVSPRHSPTKKPSNTVLKGISILAMLVLFEAFSLPRLGSSGELVAPWELVLQPGGITFHCALFLIVILLLTAIPMGDLIRAAGLSATSMIALLFAVRHVQFEIQEFGFRGHPTMTETFSNSLSLTVVLVGAIGLPAALFWRSRYTASIGSRIGVAMGLIFVAIVFVAPLGIGGIHSSVMATAYSVTQSEVALRGDVISGYLFLCAATVLIPSLLSFRQHPDTGYSALWAWLFITFLGLIPVMQALYVANFRDGGWKYVLGPLKAALFLYAIVLITSVALGHTAGGFMRQYKR